MPALAPKEQIPVDTVGVKAADGEPALNQTDAKPASVLTKEDIKEMNIVKRFQGEDRYIPYDSVPWCHWVGDIWVKPFRFNNRDGRYVIGVGNPTDKPARLGKHRHRGLVQAATVKGEWSYEEYDWIARPGDFVTECPGTIHTLHIGANTEIVFTVDGSIEFFNDDDSLRLTMDGFSFWGLYERHAEKHNIKTDESLWF